MIPTHNNRDKRLAINPLSIQQLLDSSSPQVMGILNITPDSFSDGGLYSTLDKALVHVDKMILEGATIIDIGGESTRPHAISVDEATELSRVIPILKAIKQRFNIAVSVDTSKASVMQQAIDNGADLINDVRALQNQGCIEAVAQSNLPICLMHMQGTPQTMQIKPSYDDIINDIKDFFQQRITACLQANIAKERLILDPGFGFGKTMEQNYYLLAHLAELQCFDLPLLVGVSRKSMFGQLLNREANERLAGSLSGALIAAQQGAKIIRVHDVKETADVLKVLEKVNQAPQAK